MGHGASQFGKECRERQNEQRREHGVEPLKMSKKAGQHAQQWAQHLASNNEFQHSNNKVLHWYLTVPKNKVTDKTRENAPPLVKQIWGFLEEQLEVAESREMTLARFVRAANEVTIGGFWREHAKGELRTRKDHEILKFLSLCWEKEFMAGAFSAKETIFGAFVQELFSMPISFLMALCLVYPRYLFNMGPAYMFSRGVETLRIDGYLALVLLTHGELMSFHRLMKYGEPLSMGKTHSSIDIYSYKCAAGLKTLLVEYLLMQNRHMTGEEKNPKTRDEWKEVNGGDLYWQTCAWQ